MSAENNTKRKVMHFIFLQIAILQEISRVATRYTKMMFFLSKKSHYKFLQRKRTAEKRTPQSLCHCGTYYIR